jgi:hypothetical protein
MKRRARVIRELRLGPTTAYELGAILFPNLADRAAMRAASAWLANLKCSGVVEVVGQVPGPTRRGRSLYALKAVSE